MRGPMTVVTLSQKVQNCCNNCFSIMWLCRNVTHCRRCRQWKILSRMISKAWSSNTSHLHYVRTFCGIKFIAYHLTLVTSSVLRQLFVSFSLAFSWFISSLAYSIMLALQQSPW